MVVLCVVAAILASPSWSASAGTLVDLPDKHISIEMPSGWTAQRNQSSGGIIYDLEIEGPGPGGIPYGLLFVDFWPGVVTDASLYAETERAVDEVREDPECMDFGFVSIPQNLTINGMKANAVTIQVSFSGPMVRERLIMMASDGWNLGYGLVVACPDSEYSSYASDIQSIENSITIDPKDVSGTSMLIVVGLGVVVVAVIVIVIVLLLMKKKGPEPMPFSPPPIDMMPPPPVNEPSWKPP